MDNKFVCALKYDFHRANFQENYVCFVTLYEEHVYRISQKFGTWFSHRQTDIWTDGRGQHLGLFFYLKNACQPVKVRGLSFPPPLLSSLHLSCHINLKESVFLCIFVTCFIFNCQMLDLWNVYVCSVMWSTPVYLI
jgi:hypothetical protein